MDIKEKLLKTATKLFVEKGFHATSIREIALSANVNSSMISYYFKNKSGLYEAIIKAHKEKFDQINKEAGIEKLPANKRLIELLKLMNKKEDSNIAIIILRALLEKKEKGIKKVTEEVLFKPTIEKIFKYSYESKINKKFKHFMTEEKLAVFLMIAHAAKLLSMLPDILEDAIVKDKSNFIKKEFDSVIFGILKEILNENDSKSNSN
jgi:AcrR family transcriptional regulator